MIRVDSSNINSVDYDSERSVLSILFNGGGLYTYSGVSEEVFKALLEAPSKGKYFHRNIKDVYPTSKIG